MKGGILEMKRKYFFVVLFLILAMFLVGCGGGGIVTPATDEAKIKSVVNEYYLALNNQDWSKAKSYCIYASDKYYKTCQIEDLVNTGYQYCSIVTINAIVDIQNVSINGDYGQAYCDFSILISYCGYFESDNSNGTLYLQKIGNTWKLY